MASSMPAVELFTTSILSNHKVRHRHERYVAVFAAKKIDYVYHDMASDDEAKKRFRRKALDPQIPNILVHNEWRGTFEEFEESVEFGELDLFLKIDPSKVATSSVAPEPPSSNDNEPPVASSSASTSASLRSSSTVPRKLPPAPSVMPRMAPVGSGAGPKRDSASDLLATIDLAKLKLTDADIDALLEEAEPTKAKEAHQATAKAPKTSTLYPGEQASTQEVKRTYFPSENAGVKPLRLPKMGNAAGPAGPSKAATASTPSSSSSVSPTSSSIARYSASQNSTRALAAEASASASGRNFTARQVRAGMDSGKDLQDVLEDYTAGSSAAASSVDALFDDLGLSDIHMSEQETEAFLANGTVPEGLEVGGSRLRRSKSKAGKAREEEAAKGVAAQARELAADRRASAQMAKERKERKASLSGQEMLKASPAEEPLTKPAGEFSVARKTVPEISDKTKEVLEKAKEKRASRLVGLPMTAPQSEPGVLMNTMASEEQTPSSEGKTVDDRVTDPQQSTEGPQAGALSATTEPSTIAPAVSASDSKAEAQGVLLESQPGESTGLPTKTAGEPQINANSASEIAAEEPPATALGKIEASSAAGPSRTSSVAVDETVQPILGGPTHSSIVRPSRTSSATLDETLELVFDEPTNHAKTSTEAPSEPGPPASPKKTEVRQIKQQEDAPAPHPETAAAAVDSAADSSDKGKEAAGVTPPVAEEEKLDDLLARLQSLGKSMGSGSGGDAGAPLSPPAPIAKSPRDASDSPSSPEASTPRRAPRERDTSSNSTSSRKAIDVQRTTIYPATISPSSSFSGTLPSTQATPRSPPIRDREGPTSSSSPSAASLASPPPPPTPNGSGSGSSSTSKSPKLKGKLSRIKSFGSIKRSASSSSNFSSQQQQQQQQSPSSPREAVPEVPSLGNVASRSASGSAIGQGAAESPERPWRLERTLSQVLRDADAALGEDTGFDSYDGDGDGGGGSGADRAERDGNRQSVLMPDDGLGEAEIPH